MNGTSSFIGVMDVMCMAGTSKLLSFLNFYTTGYENKGHGLLITGLAMKKSHILGVNSGTRRIFRGLRQKILRIIPNRLETHHVKTRVMHPECRCYLRNAGPSELSNTKAIDM
jgi:hypothetical protein